MIIGVAGFKRSGKDTVAEYLINSYGFIRYSLAGPMKEIVKIMFDWTEEHVNGSLKEVIDKRWGISPRQALQRLGTDWAQHDLCKEFPLFKEITGRSLWVKKFRYWAEKRPFSDIVISDIRFPHEVDALKWMKGFVFRVDRPSLDLEDVHESESYINSLEVDSTILNDGSIEDLHKKVSELVSVYKLEGWMI
jgi:hypothetical protein